MAGGRHGNLYRKEFDLLNSSFDSPSSVKKLSEEEKWDDTRKMNRLLGYNTPPARKATSPKEQYMMDWTKLHTSQEMLDYEQRMKKYVRKELQTPYEQDYHCLLYTSPSPRDLSTARMPSSA